MSVTSKLTSTVAIPSHRLHWTSPRMLLIPRCKIHSRLWFLARYSVDHGNGGRMCGPFFFKPAGAAAAAALCSPAENGFTQRRTRREMTTAKTKFRDTPKKKKNRKNTSPEFCNDSFAKKPLRNWNAWIGCLWDDGFSGVEKQQQRFELLALNPSAKCEGKLLLKDF